MTEKNDEEEELNRFEDKTKQLYNYRDSYFITEPEESFSAKNANVDKKVDELFKEFNSKINLNKISDKANYYYLKGWLLNIKNDYDKEVFDLLTKSIKLRPNYSVAWIELGECYFKKGDLKLALNCFETVLKQNPKEKKALRYASIMLRSLPWSTPDEKKQNVIKSIDLAKKALECDLSDGQSWAVLANAYLTFAFMTNRMEHNSLTKNCKSAYQKAIMIDKNVATKADVLFNYASILQYEEEFEEALTCLVNASKYDPEWRELVQRKQNLISFFNDICHKITETSNLSGKKLNSLRDRCRSDEEKLRKQYANNLEMCNGQTKQLEQLVDGPNECLLVCKVQSYTSDIHNIFYCSVLNVIDSNGNNMAIFIYDIINGRGPKSGDSIVVIRPVVKAHHIRYDGNEYRFRVIKISKPLHELYVNNRRIGVDCLSIPIINVTLKSD